MTVTAKKRKISNCTKKVQCANEVSIFDFWNNYMISHFWCSQMEQRYIYIYIYIFNLYLTQVNICRSHRAFTLTWLKMLFLFSRTNQSNYQYSPLTWVVSRSKLKIVSAWKFKPYPSSMFNHKIWHEKPNVSCLKWILQTTHIFKNKTITIVKIIRKIK